MRGLLLLGALVVAGAWPHAAGAAPPWCGTVALDNRPAIMGGPDIHVVYAVPADGIDRSAEVALRISSDLDEVDAWWRRMDPTRTPRFDLAAFSCGSEVDLTFVRLKAPGSQLAETGTRFGRIFGDPGIARFLQSSTKLLVYYDGSVADVDVCGQGAGTADGVGVAMVFLHACDGLPTAPTAAHEILHSLGAVPSSGPPNGCPGDPNHVCDSPTDILYPLTEGDPLSELVLDANHDDYYGHSGSWLDARDSPWLRHLDAQAALAVDVDGGGSVSSNVPGIACTTSCRADFDAGTIVSLAAKAHAGQRFVRWSGACTSTMPQCVVTLDAATKVSAIFAQSRVRLSVHVSGRGRVTSRSGIACPKRCARNVPSSQRVVLRAVPAAGWRFKRWSGACRGTRTTCAVPMSAATSARATFVRR